jgi:hypothetical protein
MIDIIGAISLTALFALNCFALLAWIPAAQPVGSRFAAIAAGWFLFIVVLGATGIFSTSGIGTAVIGLAVITPVALAAGAAPRSATLRSIALRTPLAALVAIHAGRLLGVFFMLLLDAGRLPATFALAAGWGDIAVGLAALPLAWAIHRGVRGWPILTFAWNLIGAADLVTAVTLGVGSAPNSPVQFIFESQAASAVAFLPWVLIPGVLVPLYLLTHLAIFSQLFEFVAHRDRSGSSGRVAWEGHAR